MTDRLVYRVPEVCKTNKGTRQMSETAIDLRSTHHVEADGSHTVTVEMTGLPTLGMAQKVSDWMRDLIRDNAHQIGRLAAKPPGVQ